MARTVITDINFQDESFNDIMGGEFTDRLPLINNALIEAPENVVSENTTGYTVAMPKWNTISGSSVQITESLTTTYGKLDTFKDVGIWVEREKAWSASEIVNTVTGKGNDPTEEMAKQFGTWLSIELHRLAQLSLSGVFATALASTHIYNDDQNVINAEGLMRAKNKLGDNSDVFTQLFLHSNVHLDASLAGLAMDNYRDVFGGGQEKISEVAGMRAFKSDKFLPSANVYTSYMTRPGSMIYKFRKRNQAMHNNAEIIKLAQNVDLELVRDAETAGGIDGLILRFSVLVPHIQGVKWDTTSVTSNPTDAQISTGSNWSKVESNNKLIQIVGYQCKSSVTQ